jgi:hypothetical protein
MPDDHEERLTILERAQLLHDATLRRHGDLLDRLEDSRLQHEARMARLEDIMVEQHRLHVDLRVIADRLAERQDAQAAQMARHEEVMLRLAQTLDAIKEMLERRNGRP